MGEINLLEAIIFQLEWFFKFNDLLYLPLR